MDATPKKEPSYHLRVSNKFENGGLLSVMVGLDRKASDYKDVLAIARSFAEAGEVVQMLGNIHYKNPDYEKYFGLLIGTEYYRKCPDMRVGDKMYEYEGFVGAWSKDKLSRMLTHGARQSPYIIIKNTKGCSDRFIIKCIHDRIKDKSFKHEIREVWVYEKGKNRLVYKKR